MNSTPLLFLGLLIGIAASWWGMIVAPGFQLGRAETVFARDANLHYPAARPGLAQQGAEIYRSEGCYTCHSQLLRPEGFGSDLRLGWGKRRTVAQDYLRDNPVMTGTIRIGPDLSDIGTRMGAGDTNAAPALIEYHLKHLYHPRSVVPGSVMPAYPYLFEKRRIEGAPSPNALKLEAPYAPEEGYEIVPKPEAYRLIDYLLSLQIGVSLPEAPILVPATRDAEEEAASDADGSTTLP